ncbi:hypothetical protein BN1232_06319 [Mycobacterium lentiflavum]|uniref:Uncharacterized protein n=1 Tax=Mycobacterium lentiflavum TaxID=141349 RepID=A0A0E3WEE2_MYCLN|nr:MULTISPECIES: hypothetical protein [Mycobacterium simiae complex]ULP45564.1 hypothetical protein MJO58_27885 [Mycobacterium lentiflavum]CQD24672.1 hypothetical protein BN1232_06319 [Mycobacterium lentiflavum]
MVNINSKSAARKRVREAQLRANEARVERERQNVDDAASFLVELGRLAAVDEWEETRILEIGAEAERRRHEHRQAGAAAVARMQGRGETLSAIAELAGVKVGDVRAVVKATSAPTVAARDALGAANGAPVARALGSNGVTAQTDDAAAGAPGEDPGATAQALGSNDVAAQADGEAVEARDTDGAALHAEDVGGRA